MRNLSIIITLLVLCTITIGSGCKKYEDGPYISFKTRKERITNIWKVEKAYRDGQDITDVYQTQNPGLTWHFDDNQNATRSLSQQGEKINTNGKWAFQSDDEELAISLSNPLYSEEIVWVIKRLTTTQLWVMYTVDGVIYEIQLKP